MVLLCRWHHHAVHEGGHTLDRSPTGTITVTRPDGTFMPRTDRGHLILAPDEPDQPSGTGPPQRGPTIPARPGTRFRTVAQRQDAKQREIAECRRLMQPRLDALIAHTNKRWPDNPAA